MSSVLIIEDDEGVGAPLVRALRANGYDTTWLRTGTSAIVEAAAARPDVVLLDLGLPDVDGVDVCRAIRDVSEVPVIVVSARGEVDDRILGLHSGADDYVVKPYDVGELVARMHAVQRRRGTVAGPALEVVAVDGVLIDLGRHAVSVDGRDVALTRKEFEILAVLVRTPGVVVSYDRLILAVWQTTFVGRHTLDVHVGSLRAKLDVPGLVQTVRGVGFRLASP